MSDEHQDQHTPAPDETTSETTAAPEATTTESGQPKKQPKIGPAVVFIMAALALVVILWFVHALWTLPPAPTSTPEVPAETAASDQTEVPGRDPAILGLRIDTVLGRFFTVPETGRTLYQASAPCENTCRADWEPYLATEPLVNTDELLGTTRRSESGEWQYTWNGQPLYTYKADSERSVLGDGYAGTWKIARP